MGLTGGPRSPPLGLVFLAQICIAKRPDLPTAESPPVNAMLSPIVIGSAAWATVPPHNRISAVTAMQNARLMGVIAADPPGPPCVGPAEWQQTRSAPPPENHGPSPPPFRPPPHPD